MEIAIVAVGRLKSGPETELVARYLDRAGKVGRQLGFRGFAVSELHEGRAPGAAERKWTEAEGIRALAAGAPLVCLDESGELIGSAEFAAWLRAQADLGTGRTSFAIGGPDGFDPALLGSASRRFSFGRLTWPHQLVRIMLAEQLYRAMTILSGHPYHRA